MILLSNVKNKRKIIILFLCFFICACDSQKGKIQEAISQLLLKPMEIPYGQMKCLTNDSLLEISPWKTAKLKLVHYVDSATCSTCFLKKITTYDQLFRLEEDYNNTFINVFVVEPGQKDKDRLYSDFENGELPTTLFVDTAHVFVKSNPMIPKYSILHTFLLDENNTVIFVGCPTANPHMMKMIVQKVEDYLGRR